MQDRNLGLRLRSAGSVLAVVALAVLVAILAGVRTQIGAGPLSPGHSNAVSFDLVAFALISAVGSGLGFVALTGLAVLALFHNGRRYDAAFVGVTVFGAVMIARVLKFFFHAVRPAFPESVTSASGLADTIVTVLVVVAIAVALLGRWRRLVLTGLAIAVAVLALDFVSARLVPASAGFDAFPSGHSVCSMALASAVTLVAWRSPSIRYPVLAVASMYVLAVGLARVYLGLHLPADVLGGWCVGLACAIGGRLVVDAVTPGSASAPRGRLPRVRC